MGLLNECPSENFFRDIYMKTASHKKVKMAAKCVISSHYDRYDAILTVSMESNLHVGPSKQYIYLRYKIFRNTCNNISTIQYEECMSRIANIFCVFL